MKSGKSLATNWSQGLSVLRTVGSLSPPFGHRQSSDYIETTATATWS